MADTIWSDDDDLELFREVEQPGRRSRVLLKVGNYHYSRNARGGKKTQIYYCRILATF